MDLLAIDFGDRIGLSSQPEPVSTTLHTASCPL